MFKHLALKAGLKPDEYWEACMEDVMEVMQAAEQNEIDRWRHTREVVYWIYLVNSVAEKRIDKAEFMPLPGDPNDNREERMMTNVERWKKMGYLK